MKWLRLYVCTLDSLKIQSLPGNLYKWWSNLMCVAKEYDHEGVLPPIKQVAFRMRATEAKIACIYNELTGLVDLTDSGHIMHDWAEWQYDSDGASAERMKRHRQRHKHGDSDATRDVTRDAIEQSRAEQIQSNVTSQFPPLNIKGPIERAQAIYAETGKPLNDRDWQAFAKEITVQDADWALVLECLEHEAAGWSGRQHDKIPFPVNWARKSPWTRMPEKKQEQTPAESAAKEAEYNVKYAHLLKPIWEESPKS